MTHDVDTADRSRFSPGAPEQVDRILVGVSIALWLAALGAGVAAIVALVGLGQAHSVSTGDSDTPWLLYSVIGVSAAVIIGAIPLLIRARQTASSSDGPRPTARADDRADAAAPPRLEPFGAPVLRRHPIPPATSRVAFPTAAVDRVWLRCTAITASAIGAAMTSIAIATYLMASHHDGASWGFYGVAGVVTVAMPIVPFFFLRQLHEVLDSSSDLAVS